MSKELVTIALRPADRLRSGGAASTSRPTRRRCARSTASWSSSPCSRSWRPRARSSTAIEIGPARDARQRRRRGSRRSPGCRRAIQLAVIGDAGAGRWRSRRSRPGDVVLADFRRAGHARAVVETLRGWLADPARELAGHDLKEVLRLAGWRGDVGARLLDSMLLSYLLRASIRDFSLAEVVARAAAAPAARRQGRGLATRARSRCRATRSSCSTPAQRAILPRLLLEQMEPELRGAGRAGQGARGLRHDRGAAGAGAGGDGGGRASCSTATTCAAMSVELERELDGARRRDLPARRRALQHQLAAAARHDPVREARLPGAQADAQDQELLDRRRDARGARGAGAIALPERILRYRELRQAQVDLRRRAAAAGRRRRPAAHPLRAGGGGDRAAVVDQPQPAEHPDPHRDSGSASARRSAPPPGWRAAGRRLQPDRAARPRAHRQRAGADRGVPRAARTSIARPRRTVFGVAPDAGDARPAARGEGDQLRHPLRHERLRPGREPRHPTRARRSASSRPTSSATRGCARYIEETLASARARGPRRDAVRPRALAARHQRARTGTCARTRGAWRSTPASRAPPPTS